MKQFYKHIYFLIIILGTSIAWGQDCDEGNPDWPSNDAIASGYEFILYITAEISIDSIDQENGKIAGFVGDQIRGTDIDGSSYFPPSDKWLYQFPIYSNQVQGETISFKFYDEINNVIIDLNETYEFISDEIIGDVFNPFILTGSTTNCECNLTTEDILGPYYFEDAPFRNIIAHEEEPGARLIISGRVKQNDCENSISGSLIEIWQANDEGCYGIVEDCHTGNPENDYFNLRGKFFSDENGDYTFESILPGYYGSRPRHIHIKITTPNEEVLISQLYFENDPFCEDDQWCQDADDRIILLSEDEFGLNGEIDLIMNSLEDGIILGDLNFDNLRNIQDIVLLVGIVIDGFTLNDFQVYSGDLNNDNNLNVLDIVQLVNIILN